MFTETDYDKLKEIMNESPDKSELLNRLLASHQITLSLMSHEIRNPLTLIYSTLQLIESQHPEVRTFKYWSDMHHDIDDMILLLDELSTYNNGERLKLTSVDSDSFFSGLVLSFASSVMNTHIEFTSQIDASLPSITCDPVKLREVILNLLCNARDAVCESSCPHIYFSVNVKDTDLIITIKDNGCGIPEENLNHIFEPFITYKKNGTGLGLAIASRIMRAHNGTISVSSDLGIGTTFTLTLPV